MSNITFTWEFPHWVVSRQVGKNRDVIIAVHWKLTASDGENTRSVFGKAELPAPQDDQPFTSKANITQDQLIEWIKPVIGYDGYVANLTSLLDDMRGPPEVHEAPVFAAPKE